MDAFERDHEDYDLAQLTVKLAITKPETRLAALKQKKQPPITNATPIVFVRGTGLTQGLTPVGRKLVMPLVGGQKRKRLPNAILWGLALPKEDC